MDLSGIFQNVSTQMLSDFEAARAAVHHAGLKGSSNEEVVKSFFRRYLPSSIEVSSGIVVDSFGNQSKQIDIILHDTQRNPIFYENPTTRVIPIEGVYAAIEVKADFNAAEQKKAFENMASFKRLEKVAFFPEAGVILNTYQLYGSTFSFWPQMYFVFAFDSPDLVSVNQNIAALQASLPPHKRIDCACILKQGVILNIDLSSGQFSAIPTPTSATIPSATTQPLFMFHTLLSVLLTQVSSRPFNLLPYIAQANIHF